MQNDRVAEKLVQAVPEDVGMSSQRIDLVKKRAQDWVNDGTTPALVLLAARRGKVVLHEAFGKTGPGSDAAKLDVSAIFPLASISKVIAATAIMMLVDDGLLGLNRPVQDYLPEFIGERKQEVMVHHLLTHTSGLVDKDIVAHQEQNRGKVSIPPAESNEHPQLHEWLWLRFDAPLSSAPGERMSYSGAGGYTLLT